MYVFYGSRIVAVCEILACVVGVFVLFREYATLADREAMHFEFCKKSPRLSAARAELDALNLNLSRGAATLAAATLPRCADFDALNPAVVPFLPLVTLVVLIVTL